MDKTNICSGLRHLLPHYQFPHGGNAETQAGRLHHPLYGGGRQGDLRDEAFRMLGHSMLFIRTTLTLVSQLNARARFVAESFLTPVGSSLSSLLKAQC